MIKLVIFDFDGTLVDSVEVIYRFIKKEVEEGCCRLSNNFRSEMGDWPLEEHLKKSGVNKNREIIIGKIKKDLGDSIDKMKPAKGIAKLKEIKIKKVILSNNSDKVIRKILAHIKIDFFDEIHSPKEFHDKAEGLRKVLGEKKIKPYEAIYIGDRDLDILAAKKVGCVSVGIFNHISWCTKEELIEAEPDFLISKLDDIPKILRKLNSPQFAGV